MSTDTAPDTQHAERDETLAPSSHAAADKLQDPLVDPLEGGEGDAVQFFLLKKPAGGEVKLDGD